MKCIKILTDTDFDLPVKDFHEPKIRFGARGIILNSDGRIAILNKIAKNEFKLIGGGIDESETPKQAFLREALEESGCEIAIDQCLGTIIEEKSQSNFIQVSFVYTSHVLNDTGSLHLTEKETAEKAQLLWLSPAEAIDKIKNCEQILKASKYADIYQTKFIIRRDTAILDYYYKTKDSL